MLLVALGLGLCGFLSSLPVPLVFTATCLAAGYFLGTIPGFLVLTPCIFVGMAAIFELTRHHCQEWAQRLVTSKFPSLNVSDATMRGVFMLRLAPVPFAFQNLFWAVCSDVSCATFMIGSSPILALHILALVSAGGASSSLETALHATGVPKPVVVGLAVLSILGLWAERRRRKPTQPREPAGVAVV